MAVSPSGARIATPMRSWKEQKFLWVGCKPALGYAGSSIAAAIVVA